MADPSLLLSASAEEIFEQAAGLKTEIFISETFADILRNRIDFHLEQLLAPEDLEDISPRLDYAQELLAANRLITFSASQAEMKGDAARVLREFLSTDQPVNRLDADQWAFLHTNSWLGSRLRRRSTRDLIARAAVKWLIVGGASFGGGTLGGVLGHSIFGPAGAYGGKVLVGRAAKRAAKAAVLAIGPQG